MSKKHGSKKANKQDEQYEKIILRMERDIEKLKAKNKALSSILKANEKYLIEISKDKTIHEIFKEVVENTEVNTKDKCPKCNTTGMKKINFGCVKIIVCTCGYRNRINEQGTPEA